MTIDVQLLHKYNQPVPRYTSYPTVPHWQQHIAVDEWKQQFASQFRLKNSSEGISLYLHLPFCESLCTYCGCNKKITTNHSVEEVYIQAILTEWTMYLKLMPEQPVIRELHLGGGTPTFFAPANLHKLVSAILSDCTVHPQHEFSIEGHPNNTTREHLEVLYALGFRRISYGVQDNDPTVQKVINRIQPYRNLVKATRAAREVGFKSINFDLIYGLPLQTLQSIEKTIKQCLELAPDRVAFYSYAHVPWTSRGQRLFSEKDLPSGNLKMELYRLGKQLFTANGYHDIGMDHFALAGDDLYKAMAKHRLHRNFMGYTTQAGGLLLGLGVSAISDIGVAYAQNIKTLHEYYQQVNQQEFPVQRGYFLSEEDLAFKKYILDIICTGKTILHVKDSTLINQFVANELKDLVNDGLVVLEKNTVTVTPLGRNFLRNICRAFDIHLLRTRRETDVPMYSKAI